MHLDGQVAKVTSLHWELQYRLGMKLPISLLISYRVRIDEIAARWGMRFGA